MVDKTTLSETTRAPDGTESIRLATTGANWKCTVSAILGLGFTTLSGDLTANSAGAVTLSTVNANVGSFGSSTAIPNFTVNAKGLITAAGTSAVVAPAGTLTGTTLASNVVTSSLTALGTIATGVWQGTAVGVAYGGTGQTAYTDGQLLIGNTATGLLSKATLTAGSNITITNGNGTISIAASAGGTPGGSNTQVQWNNAGAFGGITGATTDGTALTLVAPVLGTPASATLTNATGLPISSGLTGAGTGVLTALAVNVGSAGAVVVNGGALGTPSSGTLTNATGLPVATGISGLGTGVATFLATPSSANLASAVTGETGSGALVFGTSPDFTTGITIGSVAVPTISSANQLTNKTLTSSTNVLGGVTMTLGSDADGDIYYRASGVLTRLPKGTASQVLTMNGGATAPEWATGGGGSPGGSDTNVQTNDGGVFYGDNSMVYNKTTKAFTLTPAVNGVALTIANQTHTTATTKALSITGTYNTTSAAGPQIFSNMLPGGSTPAAGSLLVDHQYNSTSMLKVDRTGKVTIGGGIATSTPPSIFFGDGSTNMFPVTIYSNNGSGNGGLAWDSSTMYFLLSGTSRMSVNTSDVVSLRSTGSLGWSIGGDVDSAKDLIIRRAAAATLHQGAADADAPVAQTSAVQSVVAGTTNAAGAIWTIKDSGSTGSANSGGIVWQTTPAGGSGTSQNARVNALKIFGTGGINVGAAPTGGDKGAGTINLSGDIYKNDTAYTNPDFVFESYYTGRIEKFAGNDRANGYDGPLSLSQLRDYTRTHLRLPRIDDAPMGLFQRGDIALEKLEEAHLYIMELHERIVALEHRMAA